MQDDNPTYDSQLLLYHAGVAVNMDYNPWGSGGGSNNMDFEDSIKKAREKFSGFSLQIQLVAPRRKIALIAESGLVEGTMGGRYGT